MKQDVCVCVGVGSGGMLSLSPPACALDCVYSGMTAGGRDWAADGQLDGRLPQQDLVHELLGRGLVVFISSCRVPWRWAGSCVLL